MKKFMLFLLLAGALGVGCSTAPVAVRASSLEPCVDPLHPVWADVDACADELRWCREREYIHTGTVTFGGGQ